MGQTDSEKNNLLDLLQLILVSGVGPRLQRTLLDHFGSPSQVLQARPAELLAVEGIGQKLLEQIKNPDTRPAAERELEACQQKQIQLVTQDHDAYPQLLRQIYDPPQLLYYRGSLQPRDALSIAVVGSRRCTPYGLQQAERLAGALARAGMTIISGLARGIDANAHQAAIQAGGRTLAVLATGVENIYPPEHIDLAKDITTQGALVSEMPIQQAPIPGLFPQRNRIISGLSCGVIIVEASRKSGALHTARHALEQGRDVFAVPGRLDSLTSQGCHDLICDGAMLIRDADDVLEALGPLIKPIVTSENEEVYSPRELNLSDQERLVLNLVTSEQQHVDQILRQTELEQSRVLSTLTILEMKRLISRLPGGFLIRTHGPAPTSIP